jgi:hypothetical protein
MQTICLTKTYGEDEAEVKLSKDGGKRGGGNSSNYMLTGVTSTILADQQPMSPMTKREEEKTRQTTC